MSLIIQGDLDTRSRVSRWILSYKQLCDSGHVEGGFEFSNDGIQHQISNKYYNALLTILLKDFDAQFDSDEGEAIEGYILLPTSSKNDLNSDFYKYSKGVVDADVGLRLLVTFDNSDSDPANADQYFNWTLDNNFEHIVINPNNLLETRDLREKSGLPRLMEALESNMWSTMKRQKAPGASTAKVESSGASASEYVPPQPTISASAPPPTTVFNDLITKASDDSNVAAPSIDDEEVKDRVESDFLLDSLKNSLPEDKDFESFDQLSNLIDQAKSFREKAAGGALSDADRRKHAAEFAMKLSAMMSLDDESDSEDD